ncbi:hypothetical protein Fcan01_24165 [Folsomia candida]|uniref:Uncharacterized protein n=1 Tax=Folsomia candida TaxID=158441 RepID=A0A226D8K7_FOLCA|nr:hypothetical protein Fcan01_24165 [Folsomia candida]
MICSTSSKPLKTRATISPRMSGGIVGGTKRSSIMAWSPGHGYEEILTWLNWARQAGIVKFWRDGRDYTDTRKNLKEHYLRWKKVGLTKGKWARGRVKVDWEGMGLNEKVAQLFGICGVILVTGGVAFVVERLRTVTYVQNV